MYMMTVDTRWSFILLSTCTVEMGSSPLLREERESENASARDGRCARDIGTQSDLQDPDMRVKPNQS